MFVLLVASHKVLIGTCSDQPKLKAGDVRTILDAVKVNLQSGKRKALTEGGHSTG